MNILFEFAELQTKLPFLQKLNFHYVFKLQELFFYGKGYFFAGNKNERET